MRCKDRDVAEIDGLLRAAPRDGGLALSKRRALRLSRSFFAGTALLLTTTVGCWEQWSDTWFPQMKRQKAVQAFEEVGLRRARREPLAARGHRSRSAARRRPRWIPNDAAAQDALAEPAPRCRSPRSRTAARSTTATAPRATAQAALGDGPVSMMSKLRGPFGGVLAIARPASIAKMRTDGHLYSTIRYGRRRMPAYSRIPSDDRWDIVNYVRYLGTDPDDASPASRARASRGSRAVSSNYAAVPRAAPDRLAGACVVLIAIGAIAFFVGIANVPTSPGARST